MSSETLNIDAATQGLDKDAILLVDDEPQILEVMATGLSNQFDVATAGSAKEAETLLLGKRFKVVIADHLMPGSNGLSFLVRCREEFPHMQRVLATGHMKPEMLIRSVNEAALFRYLVKPVNIADLTRIVAAAVKAAG